MNEITTPTKLRSSCDAAHGLSGFTKLNKACHQPEAQKNLPALIYYLALLYYDQCCMKNTSSTIQRVAKGKNIGLDPLSDSSHRKTKDG